jgi:pentatricopeptide repeat protein
VVPSPKALTELKANKNLMDVMKMRMPKHGYVGSSLLHAKKPSTATEMWREVPGIVKRMRTLFLANQAFGAACVFESHLSTHPVIRLNPEALELAVKIYSELNRMEHACDLVDFVEEYEIKAPEVFYALLRVYIRRGEIGKAESLVLRMRQAGCEITAELYFKMAQLFAVNGREDQIKEIHQEVLMWFPDEAYRIQSVLIRYYLANDRMEEAQQLMHSMYIGGVPFHASIFSSLLEARLRMGHSGAIKQTLNEMDTLGVTPNVEFSITVIRSLLKTQRPDVAVSFIQALCKGNHTRTPYIYHMVMEYHGQLGNHAANLQVFKLLSQDRAVKLTPFSFMRVIPSVAAMSAMASSPEEEDQEGSKVAKEAVESALLTILDDLIRSGVDPQPASIGYMIDLLARYNTPKALKLARHSFAQLRKGNWKRSVGAINATAYGLYHYASLEDQCLFVDYIMNSQIIPPAYVIAIILRQMKSEQEASDPEIPSTCRFDLTAFVSLLETHAFHLELPTYIVDRFATALIERGLDILASQVFAAAMSSLKPIEQKHFGSYKTLTSWQSNAYKDIDDGQEVPLKDIHPSGASQTPFTDSPHIDLETKQRYSSQYAAHPQDFQMPKEEEPSDISLDPISGNPEPNTPI